MGRLTWEQCQIIYDRAQVNQDLYLKEGRRFFGPQEEILRNRTTPYLIFAGGVGAGKSMTGAAYMLPELFQDNKLFWIVADTFELARFEFLYLVEWLGNLGVEFAEGPNMPAEGSWMFRLKNGSACYTKSAVRSEGFHGAAVDGIIAAEAGQLTEYFVINRLMVRTSRSKGSGGWIFCDGTFEGADTWYARRFWDAMDGKDPNWAAVKMASWENSMLYPGGEDDIKLQVIRSQMTPEQYEQRYAAVPMSPEGVVMREFQTARHVTPDAEYRPGVPVQIAVDPGDSYAVIAGHWLDGRRFDQFDEVYYESGGNAERAIRAATNRPWWKDVIGGVCDVAAPENINTWRQGAIWEQVRRERQGAMADEKLRIEPLMLRSRQVEVEAGIERMRTMLHSKVYAPEEAKDAWMFDGQLGVSRYRVHPRCAKTIREFSLYRYPVAKGDQKQRHAKPVDANNHSQKALAYMMVDLIGYRNPWKIIYVRQRQHLIAQTR